MRQNCKKLLGLLAVVALWLAAPTAARAAQPDAAPENSFYLYDEEYGYYDADNPPWAYYDWSDSAEAVYLEPYVSTFSSGDEITTEIESIGSYKITIPANVTWSDSSENKEFQMTGTLEPYRRLTVSVSSENKLTHGEQTLTCGEKTLDYTLTASSSDSNLTVEANNTTCKADTDASKKDFTANYTLKVTDDAAVSGEYTDKLTFLIECVPKTYTITYHKNGKDGIEETKEQKVECGTYATLQDSLFINDWMAFAGWSTTPDYTQTVDAYKKLLQYNDVMTNWDATTENQNYDLYAQWGYWCTINVTYEKADGKDMAWETHKTVVPAGADYTWTRKRNPFDPTDEKMWQDASCDFGIVTEDDKKSIRVKRKLYDVILKGVLDGEGVEKENISEWGLATVFINGKLVESDTSSYTWEYPYGSTIEVEAHSMPESGYTVAGYEYQHAGVDNGKHILTGDGYDTTREAYYSSVMVHFKKATTGTQALLPGNDSLPVVDGELLPDDAAVYEPSDALADSTFDDSGSYWHDDTYYNDSFDTYSEPDYAPLVNPWADR